MINYGRKREQPNRELVTEAAFTLMKCQTEAFRDQVAAAKAHAIFQFHEAHVPLERITEAVMTTYVELLGEPAEKSA